MKAYFFILIFSVYGLANNIWIEPHPTICEENGGTTSISERFCLASWTNANKICSSMNLRLATISELQKEVESCNGILNEMEKNVSSESYQKCYKKKGFKASFFYWSSNKAGENLGYLGMNFEQGYYGFANDFFNLYVKCINKPLK